MAEFAIEAKGLGKRYFLGQNTSRDRLRQALQVVFPRRLAPKMDDVWAARDISFSVAQGEAIGVIGRNGAGKSTLLKLLSRVTKPTEGRALVRGRVGTLLEVGTGFHPELTGRDNVFLSGTILGMTYAEVAKKFDEIVAFAEVGPFIDTPVKRYSSGMYVRLAFSVAACLEPDILIVDEVLAVGDAAFQRKSLGRLNDASTRQGRTVLFVSHNLQAIRTFCRRVILLEGGRLVFDGAMNEGIERYLKTIPRRVDLSDVSLKDRLKRTTGAVRFTRATCYDEKEQLNWQIRSGNAVKLQFDFGVVETVPNLFFGIRLRSATSGELLTTIGELISNSTMKKGEKGTIEVSFPEIPLRPGEISLYVWLERGDKGIAYDVIDENVEMPFLRITSENTQQYATEGVISLPYRFQVISPAGARPILSEAVPKASSI
jgi:lipopolysaccharide transport system ATP-binding protein